MPYRQQRNGAMLGALYVHAAVAVVIVVAATVLGVLHDLDASALTAIYGAALGFAGGASAGAGVSGEYLQGRSLISNRRLEDLTTHNGERMGDGDLERGG